MNTLNNTLCLLEDMQVRQQKRAKQLEGYEKLALEVNHKKNGKDYYTIRKRNRHSSEGEKTDSSSLKYLGKNSGKEVDMIKEAHFLKISLSVIACNIKLLLMVIKGFKPFDRYSIEQMLPKTYRGSALETTADIDPRARKWLQDAEVLKKKYPALYPEKLKHRTADGTRVRSKSEVIIYNLLLNLGVVFVYELPIVFSDGTIIRPDFTLLCEQDYKSIIIIEHQGMMDNEEYCNNLGTRVHRYLKKGYLPLRDVFFTYDDSVNGIDTSVIIDIVRLRVRPTAATNF